MKSIKNKSIIIFFCTFLFGNLKAQDNSPKIDIYMPSFGYLKLSNDLKLKDTIKLIYSENVYFKFFFSDFKGKSYCEIYKNNKLLQKGYFENSLDTLKRYSLGKNSNNGLVSQIQVHKYFEPLKDGDWIEYINGKYRKVKYILGIKYTRLKDR